MFNNIIKNFIPETIVTLCSRKYTENVLPKLYPTYDRLRFQSWGSTSNTNIERVNKLQKMAARIILKADYTTPSADMFQRLGWMPVAKRINYNKAVLTYKAMNNLTPSYISDLLTPTALVCNRNLRSSENGSLILPKTRTTLYTGPFAFSPPKLWNTLPTAVRLPPSLNEFKS